MPHDWHANPGHAPTRWPSDTSIQVRFRNGHEPSRTFTVEQLRWKPWPEGPHDFDVVQFRRA